MKNYKYLYPILAIILILGFTSCAPQGNSFFEYGFFFGVWHGIIFPFSLMGKMAGLHIGIFADNNSGVMYWLGVIFGITIDMGIFYVSVKN